MYYGWTNEQRSGEAEWRGSGGLERVGSGYSEAQSLIAATGDARTATNVIEIRTDSAIVGDAIAKAATVIGDDIRSR